MLVGDVCYDMFGMLVDVGDCCWYVYVGCWLLVVWLCWLLFVLFMCLFVLMVMFMGSLGDVCGVHCDMDG